MSDRPDAAGAALRAEAARLNARVVSDGISVAALDPNAASFSQRDQSLLRAMLTNSLRWHHRFEWQLERLLDRPLKRRDSELAALLRIGLTQLEVLRIPDHAAVSATVTACSLLGLSHARGLVNAVLRRYLREREALAEETEKHEVARFSHPEWLIGALKRDWSEDFESILEANNALPPLWLRVNRRKIDRDAYLELLEKAGIEASAGALPGDAVLVAKPCPVEALPGFGDGLVSVQDAAAQRAADLMELTPGLRVLDACAAPGGKTAHMLERCDALEELVALESDTKRLEQVEDNLRRLGLDATLVAGDAETPGAWFDGRPFNRVLVDAPCSATGVIRRHPDIKVLRRFSDLKPLADRQRAIIEALWPLLAPGGLMLYVTCSVLRTENQDVAEAFANRKDNARIAPFGTRSHFQLLPGETNMDGFYYACLSKRRGNDKYKVSAGD
ncbi:MAG TPA: 16S rRNA (cytosine(967)-C(5))-methyltransferase RsmB [Gammaproteobacteria bacterium]|nr:16S rRNA (cytosine(967)-C(5))-methyltransferase RsmB [Gammaproteobacteria bacterium]